MQTAARASIVFVFQVFIRKNIGERKDSGRECDVDARRRFESTGRNNHHLNSRYTMVWAQLVIPIG